MRKKVLVSIFALFFLVLSPVKTLSGDIIQVPWSVLYGWDSTHWVNPWAEGVVVSKSGDVYTTGTSLGWDTSQFGTPLFLLTFGMYQDAFVAKWNKKGDLMWYRFLGGPLQDYARDLGIDKEGDVFVSGSSPSPWDTGIYGTPITPHNGSGYNDGFVAKLDPSGNLIWYTFLGGDNNDTNISAMAISKQGNVFVTASSFNGWDTSKYGNPILEMNIGSVALDIVVAKLNNNGILQWYTFLGSGYIDYSSDISVAPSEVVFVSGYSYFTDWSIPKYGKPVNKRIVVDAPDGIIARLSGSGEFSWYTFTGEDETAIIMSIDFSRTGRVFASGTSSQFPAIATRESLSSFNAFVAERNNGVTVINSQAFVASFTFSGIKNWFKKPYIGKFSSGISLDVGPLGNIYVTGSAANEVLSIPNSREEADVSIEAEQYMYLMKMAQSGYTYWIEKFPEYLFGVGTCVIAYDNGVVYVAGNVWGLFGIAASLDLDETAAPFSGDRRIFLVKVNHLHTVDVKVKSAGGRVEKEFYEIVPGKDAVVNIFPDPGYEIYKIIDNGEEVVITNPYIITFVNEDHELEIYFRLITYPPQLILTGARTSDNAWIIEKEFGNLTITIVEHETSPIEVKAYVLYKYKDGVWKELASFPEAGVHIFNDKYLTPGVEAKYVLKALAADGSVITESDILIL